MGNFCIGWSIYYTNNDVFLSNEICSVYLNKKWLATLVEYVKVISIYVVQVIL